MRDIADVTSPMVEDTRMDLAGTPIERSIAVPVRKVRTVRRGLFGLGRKTVVEEGHEIQTEVNAVMLHEDAPSLQDKVLRAKAKVEALMRDDTYSSQDAKEHDILAAKVVAMKALNDAVVIRVPYKARQLGKGERVADVVGNIALALVESSDYDADNKPEIALLYGGKSTIGTANHYVFEVNRGGVRQEVNYLPIDTDTRAEDEVLSLTDLPSFATNKFVVRHVTQRMASSRIVAQFDLKAAQRDATASKLAKSVGMIQVTTPDVNDGKNVYSYEQPGSTQIKSQPEFMGDTYGYLSYALKTPRITVIGSVASGK